MAKVIVAPLPALWVRRYNGGNGDDYAQSLAISPTGARVLVTGSSPGRTTSVDYVTIAYRG